MMEPSPVPSPMSSGPQDWSGTATWTYFDGTGCPTDPTKQIRQWQLLGVKYIFDPVNLQGAPRLCFSTKHSGNWLAEIGGDNTYGFALTMGMSCSDTSCTNCNIAPSATNPSGVTRSYLSYPGWDGKCDDFTKTADPYGYFDPAGTSMSERITNVQGTGM